MGNDLKFDALPSLTLFSTSDPVLTVVDYQSGAIGVRSFGTGVALLRWKVKGLMGTEEVCEFTIHVEADTSKIDAVIKQLLPDARIKVTKITRDLMVLSGSVDSSEDVQLLMEVAREFATNIINHLVIKPKTSEVSRQMQETAERQENLVRSDSLDSQPSNGTHKSRRMIRVSETELEVLVGCSRNCKSTSDLVRLAISNPAAIEVVQFSSKEFLIVGLASGRSTLSIWFNGEEQPEVYTIRVNQDATSKENPKRKLQISQATPVEKRSKQSGEFNSRAMTVQSEPNRPANESKRHGAQLTTDDAERLLDEVRGLRQEVRRLTEAVEQNQGTNRQSNFDRKTEEASERIKQLLSKAVNIDAEGDDGRGIPLRQALKQIRDQSSVNLIVDDGGLTEQGVSAADHINVALKNVTARTALDLILEPLGLDYMIRDEVVIVTSKVRTLGELSVQTYAVADILELFVPLSEPGAARSALQNLVDVVTTSIAPDRWEKSGGEGNAQFFESVQSLVVRQTQGVHQEVAELLSQIRKTGRMPRKPLRAKRDVPKLQSKIEQTKFDSPMETNPLKLMCFPIADLVATSADSSSQSKAAEVSELLNLIDEIKDSVGSECWEENGGFCSVDFADSNQTLLVRGLQSTHEAVAQALSKKRRAKDSKIVFETRFLQSPDSDFFESIGIDMVIDERTRSIRLAKSDAESIEALLVKREGTSFLAPKVTVQNGGIAFIGNEFHGADGRIAGMRLNIRGTLTSRHDAVKMGVAVNPQNLVNELAGRVQKVELGQYVLLDLTDEFRRNFAWTPKDGRCLVLIRPTLIEEETEASANVATVPFADKVKAVGETVPH